MKAERIVTITPSCCLLHGQAAQLVQKVMSYKSVMYIVNSECKMNVKSLLGMMLFNVSVGSTVTISADGEDATAAIDALEKLL